MSQSLKSCNEQPWNQSSTDVTRWQIQKYWQPVNSEWPQKTQFTERTKSACLHHRLPYAHNGSMMSASGLWTSALVSALSFKKMKFTSELIVIFIRCLLQKAPTSQQWWREVSNSVTLVSIRKNNGRQLWVTCVSQFIHAPNKVDAMNKGIKPV